MIYFAISFWIIFLILFIGNLSYTTSYCISLWFLLFFFFLASIRWNSGTDWDSYYNAYLSLLAGNKDYENIFEIGYTFLLKIGIYFHSYSLVLAIGAGISILIKGTVLLKSPLPLLAILGYFCTFFGDIFWVRFSISLSFTLYSYSALKENNYLKYLVLIAIASLFHQSALIFILAYPIFNSKKLNKHYFINLFFVSMFLTIILLLYGKNILQIISLDSNMKFKIGEYLSNNVINQNRSIFSILISSGVRTVVILLFFILLWNNIGEESKRLSYLVMFGYALSLGLGFISQVLVRFGLFFTSFEIILFPRLVADLVGLKKMVALLLVIGYFILRLISNISYYPDLFVPLKTIFGS